MGAENDSGGCPSWREILRENLLVILTLIGVIIGLIIGFTVAPEDPSASALLWIGMPGELYIRVLKLVIIPLIICSVIGGTSAMDPRSNGKISWVTMLFILVTNLCGSILGTSLALIIEPGNDVDSDDQSLNRDVMETQDIFADLLRNIFPSNIVASCFQQSQTKYEYKNVAVLKNNGTHDYTVFVREMSRKYLGSANSTNVLAFGVTAASVGEKGKPFLNFFRSATEIILKLMRIIIWSTPIGSASLVAKNIAATDNLGDTFRKLGMYILTNLLAEFIWILIIMPIYYLIVMRKNPVKFMGSIMPPFLIVFATMSSMVALPESFKAMEERNNVDKRISRFVAPLAATIERTGSASYIATSCIFLIQISFNEVSSVDAILVLVLSWVVTLAIPSVPSASLVTILILLTALNIPGEAIGLLFALEFLLDRVRSDVNLITQLVGVVTVKRFCQASLPPLEPEVDENNLNQKKKLSISYDSPATELNEQNSHL